MVPDVGRRTQTTIQLVSFAETLIVMKCPFVLVLVTFVATAGSESDDDFQIQPNEALQFLFRDRRSFLHPGKTKCEEQKREARKAYEEKCTFMGKRFCPKLSAWRDFQQWEIGGGYESKRNPLPVQTTTSSPYMHTMRTHRTRLYTPATLPTYRTPRYGSVSMRPEYRDESVTRNPFE